MTSSMTSYSLEDPPEFRIVATADGKADVDIAKLPPKLEFTESFRTDSVVFARSSSPGVILTNLPIQRVPPEKLALCSNIAQQCLLALSISEGLSLQYLGEGGSLYRLGEISQDLANQFLRPMIEVDKTVAYLRPDVRQWLVKQVWWRRSVESPPGTEFA